MSSATLVRRITCVNHAREGETLEDASDRLVSRCADCRCRLGFARDAGCGPDSSSLRNAVTVGGIVAHENALQNIANANGGTRASGTPGYDASLAYVEAQLKATGYFNVTVQSFTFDSFLELATPVFQRISPSPRDFAANVDFITMDYSDTGDVTGQLVATNDIVIPPGADGVDVEQRLRDGRFHACIGDATTGGADPAWHL